MRPAAVIAETEHKAPQGVETATRQARRVGAANTDNGKSGPATATGPSTKVAPSIGDQPNQAALDQCMTEDAEDEFGRSSCRS
ncbi:hypothetical protein [Actinoplanes sp. M2I2]|uniref:hypothetical protein n=1 Tax=Actinoplanes sp. M2I2 TaxID=1734444 RepID=UPI0020215073|nr:hypothetical protein [Actinoplanes sp. M2I2]